eukprot:scaffold11971_cov86-Phaeocystis_antarctica.AAC.1
MATAQSRRNRQRLRQSTCSPAPRTAVKSASVTKLTTLASSEHGNGPSEPTTKAAAAAMHMQPCTARSGGNAS